MDAVLRFMSGTFPSTYRDMEEFRHRGSDPMVNKGMEAEDAEERKNLTGAFKSLPELLMGTMDQEQEKVK